MAEAASIAQGQSVTSECGSGEAGDRVEFLGGAYAPSTEYNLRISARADGTAELVAVVTAAGRGPRRAAVQWKLDRGLGGRLTVTGCTATFSGATATGTAVVLLLPIANDPAAQPAIPQGGPRNAGGQMAQIIVGSRGGAVRRSACGAEWLQVSITGPYSTSTNWFWIKRKASGLWWGPFANADTFQLPPGMYDIFIALADGRRIEDTVTVPVCAGQRYLSSEQGWGR